jgi:probable addiction module antidote protein
MISDFDTVEYLDTEETITEFLTAALERGDELHIRRCLADATKARAFLQLARETGIERDTIYKMLSSDPSSIAPQISHEAVVKVAKVFVAPVPV